jgi:hypothetical protein
LQRPHSENPIPKIPSIFELNPPVGSSQLDLDRWFSSISINWWYIYIDIWYHLVFLWFSYGFPIKRPKKNHHWVTEFENRATKIKASPPAPASELRTQQIWRFGDFFARRKAEGSGRGFNECFWEFICGYLWWFLWDFMVISWKFMMIWWFVFIICHDFLPKHRT